MCGEFVRKILACIVVMTLLVSVNLGTALASTAQYTTTQSFLDYLDSEDIIYNYKGILRSTQEECVEVKFVLNNYSSMTCNLYFHSDEDSVSYRIWSIVTATASENYILSTLQKLNQSYKYAKFVYDDRDSTVQVEMDMYIDPYRSGEMVCANMLSLFAVVDDSDVTAMLHSLE